MKDNIAVIICAAGASSRFGGKVRKPFVKISEKPILIRSVDLFIEHPSVKQIILSISEQDKDKVRINHGAYLDFNNVQVTFGGQERFETVEKAMGLLHDDITMVAVHDAARCCVKSEWIDEVFERASQTRAAMLACPVISTIKRVKNLKITETVDRSNLYEAQTPQVFDRKMLETSYQNLKNLDSSKISDDSMLVEATGNDVSIVETDSSNIKITTKSDIPIAEAILKSRVKPTLGPLHPFEEAQW